MYPDSQCLFHVQKLLNKREQILREKEVESAPDWYCNRCGKTQCGSLGLEMLEQAQVFQCIVHFSFAPFQQYKHSNEMRGCDSRAQWDKESEFRKTSMTVLDTAQNMAANFDWPKLTLPRKSDLGYLWQWRSGSSRDWWPRPQTWAMPTA